VSTYVFTLDGLAFSSRAKFFRGPAIYHQPQRWSEFVPIGSTAIDATVMTFMGLESQRWECGRDGLFTTAEKDKLLAVYNGRVAVVWKTPQDSTGINVIMPRLQVEYAEPGPDSLFRCEFTLVRRKA